MQFNCFYTKQYLHNIMSTQSTSNTSYFRTVPKLLTILHMAGATGQIFTVEQIVCYLGKYIEKKKLYDPLNKRIVRCKKDILGEVFQADEFIVSDFKNLWKHLYPCVYPATNREVLSGELRQSKDGETSNTPELPWWYFVQPRRDHADQSQTTGKDSYDRAETAVVQDTVYEDSEQDQFLEEFEPPDSESEDSDATVLVTSDEEDLTTCDIELLQKFQSDCSSDDETTTTDFSQDSEIAFKEHWKCTECGTRNLPNVGYCQRCWKLRKGWINEQNSNLCRSLTDPVNSSHHETPMSRSISVDVTDGRSGGMLYSENSSGTSQSTMTPSMSFSSPLKHKLSEGVTMDSSEEGLGIEPKKAHLDDSSKGIIESSSQPSTSALSDSSEATHCPGPCNICCNNPNNAIMIHGNTSHQYCCYRCAKRLKKRGKPCPVCRQPIMVVVRNFIIQQ